MKKSIIEDNSASFSDVEYFPIVGELLIAKSPAEDVLYK